MMVSWSSRLAKLTVVYWACIVCAVETAPPPRRVVTYNQTQVGQSNLQAELDNILIVLVPPRNFYGSSINILDIGKNRNDQSPVDSSSNIGSTHFKVKPPEPPEIASEQPNAAGSDDKVQVDNASDEKKTSATVIPEPPEPAKSEVDGITVVETKEELNKEGDVISGNDEKYPSTTAEIDAANSAVHEAIKIQDAETTLETINRSEFPGRKFISAKLLGFGLAPAID